MAQLIRAYQLYIGSLPELSLKLEEPNANKSDGSTPSVDLRTIPKNGNLVFLEGGEGKQGFHIEVNITYLKEGKSKQSTSQVLRIFNPPAILESYLATDNVVILNAGYNTEESLPTLMCAQINRASIRKEGANRIAEIVCSEAYSARRDVTFTETFNKQWTYQQGIERILEVFSWYGVPTGSLEYTEQAKTKQFGRSRPITGSLEESLDKLCTNIGLRWEILNGEINIFPDIKDKQELIDVLQITPENIKNTIEFLDDNKNKPSTKTNDDTSGVRFSIPLNGKINKSDGVNIQTSDPSDINSASPSTQVNTFKQYEGRYLISSVKHNLSYEGGAWETVVEATKL